LGRERSGTSGRSPVGYLLFGVVYAVAAAGCTAPVFVAVAVLVVAGLVKVYLYLFEFGGLGRLGV
jgi:cytochrome c biogenesis protein CcdA